MQQQSSSLAAPVVVMERLLLLGERLRKKQTRAGVLIEGSTDRLMDRERELLAPACAAVNEPCKQASSCASHCRGKIAVAAVCVVHLASKHKQQRDTLVEVGCPVDPCELRAILSSERSDAWRDPTTPSSSSRAGPFQIVTSSSASAGFGWPVSPSVSRHA